MRGEGRYQSREEEREEGENEWQKREGGEGGRRMGDMLETKVQK